jgi:Ca2+-binding RTX toxin-like protein
MNSTRLHSLLAFGALALIFTMGSEAARGGPTGPTCFGMSATIVGPENSTDPVVGTPGDDVIVVPGWSPLVEALEGDDLVCADGPGSQDIHGGEGADRIDAGLDQDIVRGDRGDDTLAGGEGIDTLYPGPGRDRVDGGGERFDMVSYSDTVNPVELDLNVGAARGNGRDALTGIGEVQGSAHADVLIGDEARNLFDGGEGDDTISGGRGRDVVEAGPGGDRVYGGAGEDYLHGDGGRDRVVLGAATTRHGGAAFGGPGADVLIGSPARDRLYGGAGQDKGFGRQDRDRCRGIEERESCTFVAPFG